MSARDSKPQDPERLADWYEQEHRQAVRLFFTIIIGVSTVVLAIAVAIELWL